MTEEEIKEADRRREIGLRILQERAKNQDIFEDGNEDNSNAVNILSVRPEHVVGANNMIFEETEEAARQRRVQERIEKMR